MCHEVASEIRGEIVAGAAVESCQQPHKTSEGAGGVHHLRRSLGPSGCRLFYTDDAGGAKDAGHVTARTSAPVTTPSVRLEKTSEARLGADEGKKPMAPLTHPPWAVFFLTLKSLLVVSWCKTRSWDAHSWYAHRGPYVNHTLV